MDRKLRIVVPVFFGLLTVALCVLWVRSYWWYDAGGSPPSNFCVYGTSVEGECSLFVGLLGHVPWSDWLSAWKRECLTVDQYYAFDYAMGKTETLYGFDLLLRRDAVRLVLPHWFLIVVTGTLAGLTWIWLPTGYSLRTLLVATTLIAVVLGLAVWAVRL